jgi:hypothetical protein
VTSPARSSFAKPRPADDWNEHGPSVSFIKSKTTGYAAVLVGIAKVFRDTACADADSRVCSVWLQHGDPYSRREETILMYEGAGS